MYNTARTFNMRWWVENLRFVCSSQMHFRKVIFVVFVSLLALYKNVLSCFFCGKYNHNLNIFVLCLTLRVFLINHNKTNKLPNTPENLHQSKCLITHVLLIPIPHLLLVVLVCLHSPLKIITDIFMIKSILPERRLVQFIRGFAEY